MMRDSRAMLEAWPEDRHLDVLCPLCQMAGAEVPMNTRLAAGVRWEVPNEVAVFEGLRCPACRKSFNLRATR